MCKIVVFGAMFKGFGPCRYVRLGSGRLMGTWLPNRTLKGCLGPIGICTSLVAGCGRLQDKTSKGHRMLPSLSIKDGGAM